MSGKGIISILEQIAKHKATKGVSKGVRYTFWSCMVYLLPTYGPKCVEMYETMADQYDRNVQFQDELESMRSSQKYNWINQNSINQSTRDRIADLSQRELSKDPALLAELDSVAGLRYEARVDNHRDMWYYHNGWMHPVFRSSARGKHYYLNEGKTFVIE